MASNFTHTPSALHSVLKELRALEPIFHTAAFGTTLADFDRRMAPEYWEVGASGRRYGREFILEWMEEAPPVDAATVGWKTSGHALRQLGPDTYLHTYTLRQGQRHTRRSTIWRKTSQDWQVLYHQGTVITSNEDDAAPA